MKPFQLEILTPERVFYRGECLSLAVPITDGMLGVQAYRAPITASVVSGEAHYTLPDGETVFFSLGGGMFNMQDNVAHLLCEYALLPEEIDEEREQREAARARSELDQQQSRRDYLLSKLMLSHAVNNLKVKQKRSVN